MSGNVVVLTGGVGGAKLVLGLMQIMAPDRITAIVNTGDDFRHLGLWVSPDIDTLLYTLSGKANPARGWGRAGETWSFMDVNRSLGGDGWFQLGDGDLALHILRTHWMTQGRLLSDITQANSSAWSVGVCMLPMSNDVVSTHLSTNEGDLPFQRYFVERRCAPTVSAIRFEGARDATPSPGVLAAVRDADAILIAPSNPYLSIDPILAVPAIRTALAETSAPVVAVSPIIGGQAVKGPTAKLMGELGLSVTNATIAAHYAGIIDGLVIDSADASEDLPLQTAATDTLMNTLADRARVAKFALAFAAHLI